VLDGLIVWTSVLGVIVGPERLEGLCRRFDPLPIVSVEQPLGRAPVVVTEDRQGMYAAVSHLGSWCDSAHSGVVVPGGGAGGCPGGFSDAVSVVSAAGAGVRRGR
jgi:hypothetical protein